MVLAVVLIPAIALSSHTAGRTIEYADLPPVIQKDFSDAGITKSRFPDYVRDIERETDRRVVEGDREHLIYYALQSRRFTKKPPIEPAVSARRFVERLSPERRDRLLGDASYVPAGELGPDERARVADLLRALEHESSDARLAYFRQLRDSSAVPLTPDTFFPDYVRVARFLYQKEFSARQNTAAIAALYQDRPHSSDTQIDAGFAVYTGLGIMHALEPAMRVRRVLIVGPGLDLAPRTDLIDASDPQSYQPLAVADALLALSLASEQDLRVHAIDVNPRVVRAIQTAAREGLTWHLFSGVAETAEHEFSPEYGRYLDALGRAIGGTVKALPSIASDRRYRHSIAVRPSLARAMSAERMNVITERLVSEPPFDLVIVTNVLPYFDDRQLALALSNIAAMLAPGGYLLHNEARAGLAEMASAVGMPAMQMRSVILGGPKSQPLYDVVWLHQKTK